MAKRQYNEWRRRDDGTIEIDLTQGRTALIDEIDAQKVLAYKWYAHFERGRWYAYSNVTVAPYKAKVLRMHRVVMDVPASMDIDHRDGNGLNNQRGNLRAATRSQNLTNTIGRPKLRKSQYKGVYLITDRPLRKPWVARCARRKIGYFATEIEAASAYNAAALEHFGEFARLNPVSWPR